MLARPDPAARRRLACAWQMWQTGGRLRRVVAGVRENSALPRLLLAYLVMIAAEFGEWLALIVYAYARGGASAAGVVVVLQLLPALLLAPLLSAHLARLGLARLLALAYGAATLSLACCAAAILTDAPVAVVYAAAIAFSLSLGVSRPLHHVLMPRVVRHPDELTAANVATSWAESLGTLAGPALAGLMISLHGPGLACAVLAALCLCTPLLARVREARPDTGDGGEGTESLSDLLAAARVIAARPNTRALVAFPAGAAAIEGAIDLLVVVLAVQILAIGPGAAGFLSAAFGAGGLLGGGVAVLLIGRRLALPLAAAALAGGLALAALALASTVLVAVALLVIVGAARTIQSVAAQTLLQRSTPLQVVLCTFSLIESMRDVGMIFGALAVPVLIGVGGAGAAFVGMACFAPMAVFATARRIHRIDAEASIPVVEMGTLRNMGIFSALPAAPLETLAREAQYTNVAPGTTIISEGEPGESYFAIAHGSVVVTKAGSEIRRMGRGEGFGEIALLHSVRRTATVTATSETSLLGIGREAFLTAMHASPSATSAAQRIADGLLNDAP